jgi:hypothetical protein
LLKSGRKYTLYATSSKCDFFDEKSSITVHRLFRHQ